jgi:hypothetical protein
MASSPPISPKVATPLAHRKRRHSAIDRNAAAPACDDDNSSDQGVDAVLSPTKMSNSNVAVTIPNGSSATAAVARKLEDDEEVDDDDKELFEDILDTAELEPYKPGKLAQLTLLKSLLIINRQASLKVKKMASIHKQHLDSALASSALDQSNSFTRRWKFNKFAHRFLAQHLGSILDSLRNSARTSLCVF